MHGVLHGGLRDAQAHLNRMLAERDLGRNIRSSRQTLGQYLEHWLDISARPRLRPKSYRDYSSLLTRYICPRLGARPLGELSAAEIQTLYSELLDRGLSARTIRYIAPLPRYLSDRHGPDDRTEFIGATHRPLSVELQANAGILSRLTGVPSVERFFGGNRASTPFIPGEPWSVRDQPYIRSIPENEPGSAITNANIGGARYYSANLSVAKVLWGRALVPRAIGDQDFLENLDGAFASSQGELSDYYFDRNPKVSGIRSDARIIATELTTLKNSLSILTTSLGSEPQVKSRLVAVRGSVTIAALTTHAIASGKVNETSLFVHLEVPSIEKGIGRLTSKLSVSWIRKFGQWDKWKGCS
jgi:hypothetical protein